jgi:hypothetical protein
MEARIEKLIQDNNVYYTVFWSRLEKAERYKIITVVPSVAGIFELYYEDKYKKLNLFHISKAWYGGLRNWLRKITDPDLEEDEKRREILEQYDCYYRYTIVPSYADMSDILFFFADIYLPHRHKITDSGRFDNIFVNEVSEEKIVTI